MISKYKPVHLPHQLKDVKELILGKWCVSSKAAFITNSDSVDKRKNATSEWSPSIISSLGCLRNMYFNSYAIFKANAQNVINFSFNSVY